MRRTRTPKCKNENNNINDNVTKATTNIHIMTTMKRTILNTQQKKNNEKNENTKCNNDNNTRNDNVTLATIKHNSDNTNETNKN